MAVHTIPSTGEEATLQSITRDTPVEELLRAGRLLAMAQSPKGVAPFILLPDACGAYKVEYLKPEEIPLLPDHIRRRVTLEDTVSFCAYIKEFRTHTTRIFGSTPDIATMLTGQSGGLSFTAVIDFDEPGKDGKAGRAAHVAEYPCPLSLEIESWLGKNKAMLPQEKFVEFLEANQADVTIPDAATLMEMVMSFEAASSVQFTSKIDRTTGARVLNYSEVVDASAGTSTQGKIKVPDSLQLRLPIFEGGRLYEMRARIEYRVSNQKLNVGCILQRPQETFRLAIADLRADIETETGLPVFTGSAALQIH